MTLHPTARAWWLAPLLLAVGCSRGDVGKVLELPITAALYLDRDDFRTAVQAADAGSLTIPRRPDGKPLGVPLSKGARVRVLEEEPGGYKVLVESDHPDTARDGQTGWVLRAPFKVKR